MNPLTLSLGRYSLIVGRGYHVRPMFRRSDRGARVFLGAVFAAKLAVCVIRRAA